MVAALFVRRDGPYFGRSDVDPWDESRDAKKYAGPWSTVQHPPCPRWGNFWWTARHICVLCKVRKAEHASGFVAGHEFTPTGLGDDDGCFAASLELVRRWGGVIEHPEGSRAFKRFGLRCPKFGEGWAPDGVAAWVCCVDQGRYGHMARKRTWLYFVGNEKPADLDWRDGHTGVWVASGPRGSTAAERKAKGITLMVDSKAGELAKELTPPAFAEALIGLCRPVEFSSKRQRETSPPLFAEALIRLAENAK